MSVSFDFTIVSRTQVPGVSLVQPMNETAYNYLVDEAELSTLLDGSAPIANECLGDFISDAEHAHLCSAYV